MSIDPINAHMQTPPTSTNPPALIRGEDIKAILYLGIKGDLNLPAPNRTIDILA